LDVFRADNAATGKDIFLEEKKMPKKSIAKLLIVAFAAMSFLSGHALAGPVVKKSPPVAPKPDCSQTTDADLVKTLYDKLKANTELGSYARQVNFSVKDRVVTIEGWVAGKKRRKAVEKLVKKTGCVKKVQSRLLEQAPTQCPPGQKRCGEICIDEKSDCTIGT
jgi:hypothetical protein